MLVTTTRLWGLARSSAFRTADYEVAEIERDAPAKAFVTTHHYSASYPAARFRFGLYRGGDLAGVAVFSVPPNDAALTNVFPGDPLDATELGRFVLLDSVPGNGETWFLARCFELLKRQGIIGVISFSDPAPRTDASGRVVFPGHVGTIYQAHNGVYLGRGTPRTKLLLPDGRELSERSIQKARAGHKGKDYVVDLLRQFGADTPGGDIEVWLRRWLPRVTRPNPHRGNHKYAWGLTATASHALPDSRAYPKHLDGAR